MSRRDWVGPTEAAADDAAEEMLEVGADDARRDMLLLSIIGILLAALFE